MKGQCFALQYVGLQHLGRGRGFRSRGLLAALGSCKSGCSSCFADASEQGVSPRIEVGGLTWFALALRSPGCSCFCLRLDFQVTVSVRGSQGTWVLSACLQHTDLAERWGSGKTSAGGLLRGHVAFGL